MDIIRTEDDFYTSLEKALEEIEPEWRKLDGVIIVGTHAPKMVQEKLDQLKWAREQKIPCLGICMGMQLMAIEFFRNVIGIDDATSAELGDGTHIFKRLPQLRVGIRKVGNRKESHWHNYAFDNNFLEKLVLEGWDWLLSPDDDVLEEIRLIGHPFFVGTQYHPEYQSSEFNPHETLTEFVKACKKHGNAAGRQRWAR